MYASQGWGQSKTHLFGGCGLLQTLLACLFILLPFLEEGLGYFNVLPKVCQLWLETPWMAKHLTATVGTLRQQIVHSKRSSATEDNERT